MWIGWAILLVAFACACAATPRSSEMAVVVDSKRPASESVGNERLSARVAVAADRTIELELRHAEALDELGRGRGLGVVRIRVDPSPEPPMDLRLLRSSPFRVAIGDGSALDAVSCEIAVDPTLPVVHASIRSARPRQIRVEFEWPADSVFPSLSGDRIVEESSEPAALVCYHRNEWSVVPDELAALGREHDAVAFGDPLILRTFGCRIEGEGFVRSGARVLASMDARTESAFRIGVACAQADGLDSWLRRLEIATATAPDAADARRREVLVEPGSR